MKNKYLLIIISLIIFSVNSFSITQKEIREVTNFTLEEIYGENIKPESILIRDPRNFALLSIGVIFTQAFVEIYDEVSENNLALRYIVYIEPGCDIEKVALITIKDNDHQSYRVNLKVLDESQEEFNLVYR